MPSFLNLPQRAAKPRMRGLTHVLDKGLPVEHLVALLGVSGAYVDVWKFGWGTAYLDPGLRDKLAVLEEQSVLACAGGTLLEVAWQQGAVQPYLDWAADVGFPSIEVSCGATPMGSGDKAAIVRSAAQRFAVFAEVGAKDPTTEVSASAWAGEAAADVASGARWVVTEGRESGTVGLFDPAGEVRGDVADAVVAAVGVESTVFEAPLKSQQAWLIRRYGPDVNLGNIAPSDTLGLEALRLGLRADTIATEREGVAR